MKLHPSPKVLGPALVAALCLTGVAAWAQGGANAGAEPGTRVAVLNVRQAIASTAEGQQAAAELQSRFAPQQTELENLQKQMQDLQNRLTTGARTLSDAERFRLQRQGESIARQFQRKQENLNEDVANAQSDIIDTIGRKMAEVLDRYSRENNYSIVLDSSAQGSPVVYVNGPVDITADIVRLYDQTHPVTRTGSSAPSGTAPSGTAPSGTPAPAQPGTPRPAQ